MAGQRRDPIPPEIIERARRDAQRQILRRDRREQAKLALVAVRDAAAALRKLQKLEPATPQRLPDHQRQQLITELAVEERHLECFVDVPPSLEEARRGESERDVMIRILADPTPPLDYNYPPTLGTAPLATQRQIAAWVAGLEGMSADDLDANARGAAGRDKVKREAKAAREQHAALDQERTERRIAMEVFDKLYGDLSDDS